MQIDKVNHLFETGLYAEMLKAGLISAKLSNYRDIYLWVDAQVKTRGIKKTSAIVEAEVKFKIGRSTVWRALNMFN